MMGYVFEHSDGGRGTDTKRRPHGKDCNTEPCKAHQLWNVLHRIGEI